MTLDTVKCRRLLAGALAMALTLPMALPAVALGASTDPDLLATLELPEADIDYELELGTLHFFDDEDAPFAVQVLDGCGVNGHLWLFGAGLSGIPLPLSVIDLDTGKNERIVLPAFEPGKAIGVVVEPEALRVCGDAPTGGLPALNGSALFSSADGRGRDYTDVIEVLSDGRDDAYRRLVRSGSSYRVISRKSPIVTVDDSTAYDEIALFAEGRTPRRIEGVVFYGAEGMLPGGAKLDKALRRITNARVRRAFETAKNSRVPEGIIEDLGLRGVDLVHHVNLEFETLGADAYLAEAGWIKEGGAPLEPPALVDERFTVELRRADGEVRPVPLVGPLVGSGAEGLLWEYRTDEALAQIIDACDLSGSFWLLAGARTEEPLELIVTDTVAGATASLLLWTDRAEVSRLGDTAALASCP